MSRRASKHQAALPVTRYQWKPKRQGRPARPGPQDTGAELARLRTENTQLLTAEKEWSLAREILRRAAACFAKEMKRRPAAGTIKGLKAEPKTPTAGRHDHRCKKPRRRKANSEGASSCHQISHDSRRPHRRLRITRLRAGLTHPALDSLDALGRFLRHMPCGTQSGAQYEYGGVVGAVDPVLQGLLTHRAKLPTL
ncbi:transposase [Streptomyces lydicamycinicus]|uniref:Transposase n=1 Tax=Streptomyces lydicamycinicus TaxID=1546107 RepID=A0A0N7YMB3_9ACTN|nr:transposase [Streptomyces lydicamycinicus]